ncbi:recombinase family protein [Roseicella sp. DB1501]|uniref:recombinase family protein n=1 Tax=Roseicella sp. DB1501 TaxID=2730925 RepID=UPI001490AC6C|nr:recombinase family protein [Roseicella sp. DB1501]NOG74033.1 recombinase family protein [Roseicella sp. DB1501]
MKIGYARISTGDQSLDLQHDALIRAGCELLFEDSGVSGTATKRPGLDKALARLGSGDVLVVWRLDRLGRSQRHLIELVHQLGERQVGFISLTEAIDTTSPGGKLVFRLMGALAEYEHSMIRERVVAGIAAAKHRGKHIGRPRKLTPEQIEHARKVIEEGLQTPAGMAALLGVDHSTLWRALRAAKPPAPAVRGRQAAERRPMVAGVR